VAEAEAQSLRQQIYSINPVWGEIRTPEAQDNWDKVDFLRNELAREQNAAQDTLSLPSPPPGTVGPWQGEIYGGVAREDIAMYRVWGGSSGQQSDWLTPAMPSSASEARESLSLPPGNTAEFISEVTVPAGTRFQLGTAAANFGQPGGGAQVRLLDEIPESSFGPGRPLNP
jgi:hypothetical protein